MNEAVREVIDEMKNQIAEMFRENPIEWVTIAYTEALNEAMGED